MMQKIRFLPKNKFDLRIDRYAISICVCAACACDGDMLTANVTPTMIVGHTLWENNQRGTQNRSSTSARTSPSPPPSPLTTARRPSCRRNEVGSCKRVTPNGNGTCVGGRESGRHTRTACAHTSACRRLRLVAARLDAPPAREGRKHVTTPATAPGEVASGRAGDVGREVLPRYSRVVGRLP